VGKKDGADKESRRGLSEKDAQKKLDKKDDALQDLEEETKVMEALKQRNELRNDMKAELQGKEATPSELLERDGFLTADSGIGEDSGVGAMVTPEKLESMQPYPGVDYLGAGYDIFRGNPEGDPLNLIDPGFRQPIRSISYSGVTLTRDNQYLTPDGSYSVPRRSCYRSKTLSDTSSESGMQNSLSQDVSVGGSLTGRYGMSSMSAKFSASTAWRSASSNAMARSESRLEAKSYCSLYEVGWLHGVAMPEDLTPQFLEAAHQALTLYKLAKVSNLGSKIFSELMRTANQVWMQLFTVYGTHVVDSLTLGGKVVYTKFVSSKSVDKLEESGYDRHRRFRPRSKCCPSS
jgi:hypothetical protein